ncbi:MAG: MaoC/PaaZ C-terminal domain-containing protein [Gammaproteobacteria bacterium]
MKDHVALVGQSIKRIEASYDVKDTILFALGLGCGSDPTDERELKYVYEEGLLTLPTMSLVIGYPGFWMREPEYGFKWQQVLHAEEELIIHEPLPVAGTLIGETFIDEVVDRGKEKGVFVYSRKELTDAVTGKQYATVVSNTLARGDGGFGGPSEARPKPPDLPTGKPDHVCDIATLPQQALIYRLSGDMNPLHADPAVARSVGFDKPILHGRCTMGVAQRAILKTCCDSGESTIKSMRLRFSAPFFPGETLRTEIWRSDEQIHFRSTSLERETVVLNNGFATLT